VEGLTSKSSGPQTAWGFLLSLLRFTAVGKFWLVAPLCLRRLICSVGVNRIGNVYDEERSV
jgi:hypothetical protein